MPKPVFVIACVSTAVALTAAVFGLPAQEQPDKPPAPAGEPKIALLDVSWLFQNNAPFKDKLAELKADIDKGEEGVKERRKQIEGMQKQLALIPPSAPEYAQQEGKTASVTGEMAASINVQKATFIHREAAIYLDTYNEIQAAADDYAKSHRLTAVLRFSSEQPDRNNSDSVLAYINRPIVSYDAACDITRIIFARLTDKPKCKPAEPPAPQEPPPSPGVPAAPEKVGGQ